MKMLLRIVLLLVVGLACVSCGGGHGRIDVKPLQKAFSSAPEPMKAVASSAVASLKSEDFETAARALEKLQRGFQLNVEQSEAVKAVLNSMPPQPRLAP